MRYLELRRHTMRTKPGQHLSQAGVTLARKVGEPLGPFQRVITSTVPRAFETAIAMGFAVDEQIDLLSEVPSEAFDAINWEADFGGLVAAIKTNKAVTKYVDKLADFHRNVVEGLPEGGKALIVSHGGIVEFSAASCYPDFDFASLGAAIDYCEGVLLTYDQNHVTGLQVLRVK